MRGLYIQRSHSREGKQSLVTMSGSTAIAAANLIINMTMITGKPITQEHRSAIKPSYK